MVKVSEILPQNASEETVTQLSFPSAWEREVTVMLAQAAEVLGAELTANQYAAYRRLLEGVPVTELAAALDRCLRESVFMPKPAEILAAAGRSPEALADQALAEALAWVQEWGPAGRKAGGELTWERCRTLDGGEAVRIVRPEAATAPRLPWRTQRALCAVSGSERRALERLLESESEPEKYARIRREFVAAWKEARQ